MTTASLAPATRERLQKIFSELGWVAPKQQKAANSLITYVVESVSIRGGSEIARYPQSDLGGGIGRAEKEGELFKRELLARADMLPPDRAAAKAGITRQALDLRRRKGQALALTHAKRGFRYPAWQFSEKLAEPMLGLLPQLAQFDPWAQYLVLTQPEPLLDGKSVLDALRAGELSKVTRVVHILSQPETA